MERRRAFCSAKSALGLWELLGRWAREQEWTEYAVRSEESGSRTAAAVAAALTAFQRASAHAKHCVAVRAPFRFVLFSEARAIERVAANGNLSAAFL